MSQFNRFDDLTQDEALELAQSLLVTARADTAFGSDVLATGNGIIMELFDLLDTDVRDDLQDEFISRLTAALPDL